MDAGTRGWIVKFAQANLFRLAPLYELEDLTQDGFLIYYKLVRRYPHATKPAHLMALVKTSYANHVTDLCRKASRRGQLFALDLEADLAFALSDIPIHAPAQVSPELALAPLEFRQFIAILEQAPELIRAPYERRANGTRETTHERHSRLIGGQTRNLLPRLHSYLTEALAG